MEILSTIPRLRYCESYRDFIEAKASFHQIHYHTQWWVYGWGGPRQN